MISPATRGKFRLAAAFLALSVASLCTAGTVTSLDPSWKFLNGDAEAAQNAGFNDSGWRSLDVPHDWSIEGPYAQEAPTRGSGGSLPAGVGWYRKTFTLPASDSGKRVFIDFEGVMANSDVWINGQHLGKRPFGYISFRYEMTGHLNFGEGKTNIVAVRADNSQQPASRWYAGAGIYRHVRMIVTDPVHVDQWGTYITTPQVSADAATVKVATTVVNQADVSKDVTISTAIIGPDGQTVQTVESPAQSIAAGKSGEFTQEIKVASPKLWNSDSPNMYRAKSSVRIAGKVVDEDVNTFGIRNAEFKSETGFWLNGKNMKLLGVCLHHDGGAFGSAVPIGVWERRLTALRELGVNAIRTAHNPPDPAFLDLCDRMGFLVMDETFDAWTVQKNPFDYSKYFKEWNLIDTRDMVKRDRNHPSIILYSTGNEIHDTPNAELAKSLLKPMVDEMHKWDPTRPVTQALFRPNVDGDGGAYKNGLADMLDVIGTNYRDAELLVAWRDKPGRIIVGTEQGQTRDTWLQLRDNPQHSGQFLWAGIDYLGEAQWPATGSASGLLDRLGQVKPQGYERASWWASKPMVKIIRGEAGAGGRAGRAARGPAPVPDGGFGDGGADRPRGATSGPATARGARGARAGAAAGRGARAGGPAVNWTLRPDAPTGLTDLTVHSNCDEVELFLNDRSLGAKPKNANDAARIWTVAYEAGTIKAVGKNKGQTVAADEMKSAGKAAKIMLAVDQTKLTPTFDDVSFVRATIVDEQGVVQPYADNLIKFKVTGPGKVAAVDNADRTSHEPYNGQERSAYQGRATAVVKATAEQGTITLEAAADGLTGATVSIQTAKP